MFINDAQELLVRAIRSHNQTIGAAGKVEPALSVEHHDYLEATGPPSLMVIDQAAMDSRLD